MFVNAKKIIGVTAVLAVIAAPARSLELKLEARVPTICRMDAEPAVPTGDGYHIAFNTFCNTEHSAVVNIESMPTGVYFVYNGVRLPAEGGLLQLSDRAPPENNRRILEIHGVSGAQNIVIEPNITTHF